jgi:hypothetical protein
MWRRRRVSTSLGGGAARFVAAGTFSMRASRGWSPHCFQAEYPPVSRTDVDRGPCGPVLHPVVSSTAAIGTACRPVWCAPCHRWRNHGIPGEQRLPRCSALRACPAGPSRSPEVRNGRGAAASGVILCMAPAASGLCFIGLAHVREVAGPTSALMLTIPAVGPGAFVARRLLRAQPPRVSTAAGPEPGCLRGTWRPQPPGLSCHATAHAARLQMRPLT